MVLERSSGFAVTAVDEKAELGQWYWKGPDLLLQQLMRRPSWVSGTGKVQICCYSS